MRFPLLPLRFARLTLAGLLLAGGLASAQTTDAPAPAGQPTDPDHREPLKQTEPPKDELPERGLDHQRVRWVSEVTDEEGNRQTVTNSYVQLETGFNRLDERGELVPSDPSFELTAAGAQAWKGRHRVTLAGSPHGAGAVQIRMPDNRLLVGHVVGLAYYDAVSGAAALIAETRAAEGWLTNPNQVTFLSAFNGVDCDLRYTSSRSGLEQDLIIRETLPDPALLGLSSASTRLEVWTEFTSAPEPVLTKRRRPDPLQGGRADEEDELIDLGAMQIGEGRAFSIGDEARPDNVSVRKRWLRTPDQRVFLIEAVDLSTIQARLSKLPKGGAGLSRPAQLGVPRMQALLALPRKASAGQTQAAIRRPTPEQALALHAKAGFVMDYQVINPGTLTNYTFLGDLTYRVNGVVYLSGTTTLEGGSVIKYSKRVLGTNEPALFVQGPFVCRTAPMRPAIFTASDDDTVGEKIIDSTGTPGTAVYANFALRLLNAPGIKLENVRFFNGNCTLSIHGSASNSVVNAQFFNCGWPIVNTAAAALGCYNVLIQDVTPGGYAFDRWGTANDIFGEHVTVRNSANLRGANASLTLKNSLVVQVASVQSFTNSGGTVEIPSATGVFQSVGGSHSYLADSTHRNVGVTSIVPELTAAFRAMTTYPPQLLTNYLAADTVLFPVVPRDTEQPDRGYHYAVLDWLAAGLTLTNATLSLTNGARLAFWGTNTVGLTLQSGSKLVALGRPDALNWLGHAAAVQEQRLAAPAGSSRKLLDVPNGTVNVRPEVSLRFTAVDFLADTAARRALYSQGNNSAAVFNLRDCQLANAALTFGSLGSTTAQTLDWFNNVFRRSAVSVFNSHTNDPRLLKLRNNLVSAGTLDLVLTTPLTGGGGRTIQDNLFDAPTFYGGTPGYATLSHNGYTAASAYYGGSGNKTGLVLDWVSGPFGPFYYPPSGTNLFALVNAGSQNATNAGLYHFTTQTNLEVYYTSTNLVGSTWVTNLTVLRSVREAGSVVDIGYHNYSWSEQRDGSGALLTSGILDHDLDSILDYLEDVNGNGVTDGTESNWMHHDPDSDELRDFLEVYTYGTDPNLPDTDGDGIKDGPEVLFTGTNPFDPYDAVQQRLAHWRFNNTANLTNEAGCAPAVSSAVSVNSFDGTAPNFTTASHQLRYPWAWTNGVGTGLTNFTFRNGTVRFTYVPSWYSNSTSLPTNWCRLIECGDWALSITPDGTKLVLQSPAAAGGTRTNFLATLPKPTGSPPAGRIGWDIAVSYRPWISWVHINGEFVTDGTGVQIDVPPATRAGGVWFGSGASGANPALGFLDEVESFNAVVGSQPGYFDSVFARLWDLTARRAQVLAAVEVGGGLQLTWQRGWEGDWLTNSAFYGISRRPAGTLAWTTVATDVRTNSWTDTTAVVGSYYEYRVGRHTNVVVGDVPTIAAARKGAPVDARGRAILLVDNTISNAIASELDAFKRDLVADGWLVLATNAPRHSDLSYPVGNANAYTNGTSGSVTVNKTNANALKAYLQAAYTNAPGLTNVVFLIGHVTIPYSGYEAVALDGHGDHSGAWPADSWYGDLSGTWTDSTINLPNADNVINYNVAGDGRWDQDKLPPESDGSPGRIEMGVGRIDFNIMEPFRDQLGGESLAQAEVRLLKLYFDKVKRWRRAQIAHQSDHRSWTPHASFYNLIRSVQRLQPRLWGGEALNPSQFTNDLFFATTNHLWGVHGDFGHFTAFGKDQGEPRLHLSLDVAKEVAGDNPRGLFQLHFGSYMGEWFHWDQDPLRVVLGMTNAVLTSTWLNALQGTVWRPDRFHLGAPYATALQDSFAAHAAASCRGMAILGDPFLREHPLAPVSSLTATKSSPNIVLSWPTQAAATDGYRIYRASSTNSTTWTWLANVATGVTSWTNTSPASPSTNAYMIKSLSLKTTGSGSYTNASLGTFSATEVTLP